MELIQGSEIMRSDDAGRCAHPPQDAALMRDKNCRRKDEVDACRGKPPPGDEIQRSVGQYEDSKPEERAHLPSHQWPQDSLSWSNSCSPTPGVYLLAPSVRPRYAASVEAS